MKWFGAGDTSASSRRQEAEISGQLEREASDVHAHLFPGTFVRRKTLYGAPLFALISLVEDENGAPDLSLNAVTEEKTLSAAGRKFWNWYSGKDAVFCRIAPDMNALPVGFPATSDQLWRALGKAFKRRRPLAPLNGVVLTIPLACLASDAAGKKMLEQLGGAAGEMTAQLAEAQGAPLPVYVVLTDATNYLGFKAFLDCMPAPFKQQGFGHMVERSAHEAAHADALTEAFDAITERSYALLVRRWADVDPLKEYYPAFVWHTKWQERRAALEKFAATLFFRNRVNARYFCRGLFVCGPQDRDGWCRSDLFSMLLPAEQPTAIKAAFPDNGAGLFSFR